MNNGKFGISAILAGILCACADAQIMDISTNYYRDYLDLAQNKGKFAPSDGPVTIDQRNGGKLTLQRIPNNGARNNKGNYTALGRNYVVTATHVEQGASADNYNDTRGWFGNTRYEYLTSHTNDKTAKAYNTETTYLRTNKYIVEGNIDPLDVPYLGVSPAAHNDQDKAQAEAQKIQDYFKKIKDTGGAEGDNINAYQAGIGELAFEKTKTDSDGYDEVVSRDDTNSNILGNQTSGGGLNGISTNYSVAYKKTISLLGGKTLNGIYMLLSTDKRFRNKLYTGDSGSGFFVYDTIKNKWVLVGVTSVANGTDTYASIVSKADFDDYKKAYEHAVNDNNVFSSSLVKNKDNILTTTSNVTLNSDLDLGHGGIVVKSGEVTLKKDAHSNNKIKKLAGFDVASGAKLNLNVVSDTSIHKIGEGTLIVNSSGNKTLRLGQGSVELAKTGAFSDIYITSGRGTLKLGVSDDLNDKIFFGNGGGKLDLNGNNQTFSNVAANSNDAKITNLSGTKSTLTIKSADNERIFHAKIEKNIDIAHNGDGKNKQLVFDGGFDVSGAVSFKNAKVSLQGHPTTHALGDKSVLTEKIKNKVKAAGVNPPDYMDLERPSTLAQPDWDKREFKANGGIELNSSELTIGKEADVKAEIKATNSVIHFGGLHYIDKFDGSNTYNESESNDALKFRQQVESGQLVADINYTSKIVMDSDSLLKMGAATTRIMELVINDDGAKSKSYAVEGDGKFEIDRLEVSGKRALTFGPETLIKSELKVKDYQFKSGALLDFKKILKLGQGMKFDFGDMLKLQPNTDYTIASAEKIENYGANFNNESKVGDYYVNYEIKNNKLVMRLSETKIANPQAMPQPDKNNGANSGPGGVNSAPKPGLRLAEFSDEQNKVLDLLKGTPEYENAERNGDFSQIKKIVQKAESDMKNISQISVAVSVRALQTSNELINSRLSNVMNSRASEISRFKIAALESDAKPTAAMIYEAVRAQKTSNVWANVNGAYFKDKITSGDLKLYGTNIGYDRLYDEFILGVSAGVAKAKFSSDALSDDATIYSFGAYGLYEFGAHELQSNLNLAFTSSKRAIDGSQKASVKITGALLSNYYKYGVALSKTQQIKPVLAVEFGASGVGGFKNDRYKQKNISDFNIALGVGGEFVLNADKNEFVAQFLVKQNVYNSADKSYISLNNSSQYVDYKLENGGLGYRLNLTANTRLTRNFGISYQLVATSNKDGYGVSGNVKAGYKF